jgi:hypothetical protein
MGMHAAAGRCVFACLVLSVPLWPWTLILVLPSRLRTSTSLGPQLGSKTTCLYGCTHLNTMLAALKSPWTSVWCVVSGSSPACAACKLEKPLKRASMSCALSANQRHSGSVWHRVQMCVSVFVIWLTQHTTETQLFLWGFQHCERCVLLLCWHCVLSWKQSSSKLGGNRYRRQRVPDICA